MKQLIKKKIAHMELIRQKMVVKGWKPAKLARVSGVTPGVLSRYFNKGGISADNLFAVLNALDLFYPQENFMCDWPESAIDYCKKLKEILDAGDQKEIMTIKEMIDVFTDRRKLKKSSADASSERLKKNIGKKSAT